MDKCDVCIWDATKKEVSLTLEGHTDAIMWAGFSLNDKLIGSVSWDKTFRIWSHANGILLHIFKSNHQNWTGGFSPDSRFFVGRSGEGRFWVWNVVDGSEIATHAVELHGCCRTLNWSPDGKQLVVGRERFGRLVLYDLESRSVAQERLLSPVKSPEELWGVMLEVSLAKCLPGGSKIAFQVKLDHGVEIEDLCREQEVAVCPWTGTFTRTGLGSRLCGRKV